MIFLDRPDLAGPGLLLTVAHLQLIGGPVLRVTVWGDDPKHLDHAIACEMHDAPVWRNRYLPQWPIPRAIWIDVPIRLELRQPVPPKGADQLEVGQTAVLTIEGHQARREAALVRGCEYGLEVVVFGCTIDRLIIEPIVTGDARAIASLHSNVTRLMPWTTRWCLPDQCCRTSSIVRA